MVIQKFKNLVFKFPGPFKSYKVSIMEKYINLANVYYFTF